MTAHESQEGAALDSRRRVRAITSGLAVLALLAWAATSRAGDSPSPPTPALELPADPPPGGLFFSDGNESTMLDDDAVEVKARLLALERDLRVCAAVLVVDGDATAASRTALARWSLGKRGIAVALRPFSADPAVAIATGDELGRVLTPAKLRVIETDAAAPLRNGSVGAAAARALAAVRAGIERPAAAPSSRWWAEGPAGLALAIASFAVAILGSMVAGLFVLMAIVRKASDAPGCRTCQQLGVEKPARELVFLCPGCGDHLEQLTEPRARWPVLVLPTGYGLALGHIFGRFSEEPRPLGAGALIVGVVVVGLLHVIWSRENRVPCRSCKGRLERPTAQLVEAPSRGAPGKGEVTFPRCGCGDVVRWSCVVQRASEWSRARAAEDAAGLDSSGGSGPADDGGSANDGGSADDDV